VIVAGKRVAEAAVSKKACVRKQARVLIDIFRARWYPTRMQMAAKSGWDQFVEILFKPDNIPIAGMLVLVLFFTWIGLKQARRNDQLMAEGRDEEMLKEMGE
jgi:hypothetical protein